MSTFLVVYGLLFVLVGHVLLVQKAFRALKAYFSVKRITSTISSKPGAAVAADASASLPAEPDQETMQQAVQLMQAMLGGDLSNEK